MSIRDVQEDDVIRLREIFKKTALPENCMPDLSDPLIIVKKLVEEESGCVAMVAVVRLTAEPYLLLDHSKANPRDLWAHLRTLTEAVVDEAKNAGITQLTCWVPPHIEKSFGKRLEQLGFFPSPWKSYSRNLFE